MCYYQSEASCLLNGASCLINVRRVVFVLGQVLCGVSCLGGVALGPSCLWGEFSCTHIIYIYMRVFLIYKTHSPSQ